MEGTRAQVAIIDAQLTMVKKKMSKASTKVCCELFVSELGAPVGQFPRLLLAKSFRKANLV